MALNHGVPEGCFELTLQRRPETQHLVVPLGVDRSVEPAIVQLVAAVER